MIKNRNKLSTVSELNLKPGDSFYDHEKPMWVTEVNLDGSVNTFSVDDVCGRADKHYLCVRTPERDSEAVPILQGKVARKKSMLRTLCSGRGANPNFITQVREEIHSHEAVLGQLIGDTHNGKT